MSLINKMLQDLEARQQPPSEPSQKNVYQDLKPISRVTRSRTSPRLMIMVVLVLFLGAGAYAWMEWGDLLRFGDVAPGKTAPVATRKAPAPKATPMPVPPASAPPPAALTPAPAMVAAAPTANLPTPVPVAEKVTTASAATIPVQSGDAATAPSAKPVKPEPPAAPSTFKDTKSSKAEAAKAGGYWTVSRGETLYGIAAQTGIDLWQLSNWNGLGKNPVIHAGQRLRLTPPDSMPAIAAAKSAEPHQSPTRSVKPAQKAPSATTVVGSASVPAPAGDQVIDRKLKPYSSNEQAESEYRRAVELLNKGRRADAERQLQLALKTDAAHTPARELLAGLMLQQGHWREAQDLLEQGVERVPEYAPFAQLLARVYVEHGSEAKALSVLENGRGPAARNPDYLAFLAALYQRTGKHAEAVKTYQEVVALNPQEGRGWLGLGISLEALQDWNSATTAFARAMESATLDDNLMKYARQRHAYVKNK